MSSKIPRINFKTAWITASLGAFAGDGISFWIGHHYKRGLLKIWPMYKFPKLIDQGQSFFSKWGLLSVFIGRFVGLVRPIIPAIAGMMAMPIKKYLAISTIAAILWAPFYLLPGMLFGNAMGAMSKVAGKLALLVIIFVCVVAFVYWIVQLLFGYLLPRTHKNTNKMPANSLSYIQREQIKTFINENDTENALPLPGRLPNLPKKTVLLLPSDKKVADIHILYNESATQTGYRPICLKTFRTLWNDLCPHIQISKPSTDLCHECQRYSVLLSESGKLNEIQKQEILDQYGLHVCRARV